MLSLRPHPSLIPSAAFPPQALSPAGCTTVPQAGFIEHRQPVAPGWGTRKSSSPPGPGGAARAYRLDHLSQHGAANNPRGSCTGTKRVGECAMSSARRLPPLACHSPRGDNRYQREEGRAAPRCGAEVSTFNLCLRPTFLVGSALF